MVVLDIFNLYDYFFHVYLLCKMLFWRAGGLLLPQSNVDTSNNLNAWDRPKTNIHHVTHRLVALRIGTCIINKQKP